MIVVVIGILTCRAAYLDDHFYDGGRESGGAAWERGQ